MGLCMEVGVLIKEKGKHGLYLIILAITLLVFQLYCLPIIRYADYIATGQMYADIFQYIIHFPVNIAFAFNAFIFGTGFWLICKGRLES